MERGFVTFLLAVTLAPGGCASTVRDGCHTDVWLCAGAYVKWAQREPTAAQREFSSKLRSWERRCERINPRRFDYKDREYVHSNICLGLAMLRLGSSRPEAIAGTSTMYDYVARTTREAVSTLADDELRRSATDDFRGGAAIVEKMCGAGVPGACDVRAYLAAPHGPPPGWATPNVRLQLLQELARRETPDLDTVAALAAPDVDDQPDAQRRIEAIAVELLAPRQTAEIDQDIARIAASPAVDVAALEQNVRELEARCRLAPDTCARIRRELVPLAQRTFAAELSALSTTAPDQFDERAHALDRTAQAWAPALDAERAELAQAVTSRFDAQLGELAAARPPASSFEDFAARGARVARALDGWPTLRQPIGDKLRALVTETLDAEGERLLAARRFAGGERLVALMKPLGLRDRAEATATRLRKAAQDFHAAESRRHLAAGRLAAARLHAAIARRYGGAAPEVPRPVDPAPPLRLVGTWECFAPAFSTPPPAPPDAAVATITWTEPCTSSSRQWNANEPYTYEVTERVPSGRFRTERVAVQGSGSAERCTIDTIRDSRGATGTIIGSRKTCTPITSTHYEERHVPILEDRKVTRTAKRLTSNFEQVSRGEAQIVVSHAGISATLPFSATRQRVLKDHFGVGPGPHAPINPSMADFHATIVADLRTAAAPGGAVHRALNAAKVRAWLDAAKTATPDVAEDLLARALLLDPNAEGAAATLAASYDLTPPVVAALVR